MAPKRHNARDITPSSAATTQAGSTTAGTVHASAAGSVTSSKQQQYKVSSPLAASKASYIQMIKSVWSYYLKNTPQRTRLIDLFMAFLMIVGALQMLYCVLAGNYVSFDATESEEGGPAVLTIVDDSLLMPSSPALAQRSDSLSSLVS